MRCCAHAVGALVVGKQLCNKFFLIQKHPLTENYQTACRLYESDVVSIASNELKRRASENHGPPGSFVKFNSIENLEPYKPDPALVTGSKFSIELNFTEDESYEMNENRFHYSLEMWWQKTKATIQLDPNILGCLWPCGFSSTMVKAAV